MKIRFSWDFVSPFFLHFLVYLICSSRLACNAINVPRTLKSAQQIVAGGNFIIEVGLPKSGTTSMLEGFSSLGVPSTHYHVPIKYCNSLPNLYPIPAVNVSTNNRTIVWDSIESSDGCYIGVLIQKSLSEGKKPFDLVQTLAAQYNQHFQGFFQIDACRPSPYGFCRIMQVFGLDQLTEAYPNAYYILNTRLSSQQQVASMDAWANMLSRYQAFGYFNMFPGQSPSKSIVDNAVLMIENFHNITRSYFQSRKHLKFLEVCLEDSFAATKIASFVGINSFSLFHRNAGTYSHGHTPAPTKQHVAAPIVQSPSVPNSHTKAGVFAPSQDVPSLRDEAASVSNNSSNTTVPLMVSLESNNNSNEIIPPLMPTQDLSPKQQPEPGELQRQQLPQRLVIEVGLPRGGSNIVRDSLRAHLVDLHIAHSVVTKSLCESLISSNDGNSLFPIASVNVSSGIGVKQTWDAISASDGCYVGLLMQKAIQSNQKPFDLLNKAAIHTATPVFNAFFQLDICRIHPYRLCVFPQVFALDQITRAYPDALYILNRRLRSRHQAIAMKEESNQDKLLLYQSFGYLNMFPGQSHANNMIENGAIMINAMHNITRTFFKSHPELHFLEICPTDEPDTTEYLLVSYLNISFPFKFLKRYAQN